LEDTSDFITVTLDAAFKCDEFAMSVTSDLYAFNKSSSANQCEVTSVDETLDSGKTCLGTGILGLTRAESAHFWRDCTYIIKKKRNLLKQQMKIKIY